MSSTIAFSESEMAKRVPLAEQVPLDKPFAVRISPCCLCNLRCEFCAQATGYAEQIWQRGHRRTDGICFVSENN